MPTCTTPRDPPTFPANVRSKEAPIVDLDPLGLLSDPKSLITDPKSLFTGATKLLERFGDEAYFALLCIRSGVAGPELPHRVAQLLLGFERFGLLGGAITAGAIRHGDRLVIIDERGSLSYKELDARTNALANAWREQGLKPGEGVAILVRNHRGFLEAVFGAAKCGARIVLLNTSFAGPQIREVAGREGTDLLVYDEEYSETLEDIDPPRGRFRAWADEPGEDTLDALIEGSEDKAPPKPGQSPRITILTSGTTGSPKGAPRSEPRSLALFGGLFSKVPFRARETTELCVPMFHALGFMQAMVGVGLGSTMVVRRRFDPEETIDSLEEHQASAMVVVPVMLQRIVDTVGVKAIKQRDLGRLKIIFVSGSALGAELSKRALKAFGPVVYNLYGSTEIAYATIATPEDLAEEAGSVGKVVRGSVVKIIDDDGNEVPRGSTGRVFVGNISQFEGYTGGGSKEEVGGLMSSGDLGHFDDNGRLFIDGRDDEMIVSGGENVFPAEVEEAIASYEGVQEAAAVGVDDEKFGQGLKAFVVLHEGAEVSDDDIKKFVAKNLARYKTPREVVFVDSLPRNQTGKVLKKELLEREGEEDGAGKPQEDGKAKEAQASDKEKSSGKGEDSEKAAASSDSGADSEKAEAPGSGT